MNNLNNMLNDLMGMTLVMGGICGFCHLFVWVVGQLS
jgi:hypothetical protein